MSKHRTRPSRRKKFDTYLHSSYCSAKSVKKKHKSQLLRLLAQCIDIYASDPAKITASIAKSIMVIVLNDTRQCSVVQPKQVLKMDAPQVSNPAKFFRISRFSIASNNGQSSSIDGLGTHLCLTLTELI